MERPQGAFFVGRGGVLILTAVLVMAAGQATGAWAAASYETQPVLKASDLAPAAWFKGARFKVEDLVPTEGFLGRFIIRLDVGTFEAHGLDMLQIRIAELAALEQLEAASKTVPLAELGWQQAEKILRRAA